MLFESRSFWHPKDSGFVKEYEDSFAVGPHGVVAVADGVSSAIFSRQWAQLLTQATIQAPPDLSDGQAFQDWLGERRAGWRSSVDFSKLDFFKRQKLQQIGGAYSTLLWVELYPRDGETGAVNSAEEDGEESSADADAAADTGAEDLAATSEASETVQYYLRCFSLGDCCLFHVRDGQLLRRFPMEHVAEFDAPPSTVCSINHKKDHLLEFQFLEDECLTGDLLVLTSDALGQWLYKQQDAELPIDWQDLWQLDARRWTDMVAELRLQPEEFRMRADDTTLVMLRLASRSDLLLDSPPASFNRVTAPAGIEPEFCEPTETEPTIEAAEGVDATESTTEVASANETGAMVAAAAVGAAMVVADTSNESGAETALDVEQPLAESPAAESPVAETSVVETPAAETPVAESPTARAPATGGPAVGESTVVVPPVEFPEDAITVDVAAVDSASVDRHLMTESWVPDEGEPQAASSDDLCGGEFDHAESSGDTE